MSLGIEVVMHRVAETDDFADYTYAVVGEGAPGRLRLAKQTGRSELLAACAGETPDHLMFQRGAYKLSKHWRTGEIPAYTSWAG